MDKKALLESNYRSAALLFLYICLTFRSKMKRNLTENIVRIVLLHLACLIVVGA